MALVEHQVQHRQHPGGAFRQQMRGRYPIGDPGGRDLRLGAGQALGHRRLGHQERLGDLGGAEPGEAPQRQGHPALQREGRVTAGEDQPQAVVLDLVGLIEQLRHRFLIGVGLRERLAAGLLQQLHAAGGAPQPVDRAVAGDGRQPGAGALRDAVDRPAPQRLRERLLGALLGQVPVAGPPDQRGDDAAPLLAEGSIHRALNGRRRSFAVERADLDRVVPGDRVRAAS